MRLLPMFVIVLHEQPAIGSPSKLGSKAPRKVTGHWCRSTQNTQKIPMRNADAASKICSGNSSLGKYTI
jgi:hypothetical protein